MTHFMKKTCALCPFSRSKTLGLHPNRAEEFAYTASNPYTDFPCHKTAEYQEETDYESGGYVFGAESKTCHGFLALQSNENGLEPDGFVRDGDGFEDVHEMIEHHEKLWDERSTQ